MNNKPVAWMSPDGKVSDTEGKLFYIPLYTHPVKEMILPTTITNSNSYHRKELTDEEAFSIFADEAMKDGNYNWKAGVRAILRKAQE